MRRISIGIIALTGLAITFISFQNFTTTVAPSLPDDQTVTQADGLNRPDDEEAAPSSSVVIDTAAEYAKQLATAEPLPEGKLKALSTSTEGSLWSDPKTWGGVIPTYSDDVIIPVGVTVIIDTHAKASNVRVRGVLKAANADVSLRTRWVMVMGSGAKFLVGSAEAPFLKKFTLELIGTNSAVNHGGAGTKFLMAMSGGEIQMHGKPKLPWTKLSETINPGQNSIKITDPANWEVGDKIVIASTDNPTVVDPALATEERTITSISTDGRVLTLDRSLDYRHISNQNLYSNGKISWRLVQKAEVGLLTRNVKVQGDSLSTEKGFGAHIMIMGSATDSVGPYGKGFFSNIELTRMGQKPQNCTYSRGVRACDFSGLGRYPIHWHLVQAQGAGQYIKNSSIHRTFNRGITIHGTDSLLVEKNVIFDTIGHTIFLEDGGERFNKFLHNLVLLARKPARGEELLPTDNQDTRKGVTPAMFWITNPNNSFYGNVAAGSEGTGYWFVTVKNPHGPSKNMAYFAGQDPSVQALGLFQGNTAHSVATGLYIGNQLVEGSERTAVGDVATWNPPKKAIIRGFTSYANRWTYYGGVMGGEADPGVELIEMKSADSQLSLFFGGFSTVRNSLFIFNSGNEIKAPGLMQFFQSYGQNSGRVYDSHFIGWNGKKSTFLQGSPTRSKHGYKMAGLTFDPPGQFPTIKLLDCSTSTALNVVCPDGNFNVFDIDGTLTGKAGSTILSNVPILRTSDGFDWKIRNEFSENAFASPYEYIYTQKLREKTPVIWTRIENGNPQTAVQYIDPHPYSSILRPNSESFTYTYKKLEIPSMPTNIVMTNQTNSSITLAWGESVDNESVAGYYIERCEGIKCPDSEQRQVGVSTVPTFIDIGLKEFTQYRYRVRAFDNDGNTSSYTMDFIGETTH